MEDVARDFSKLSKAALGVAIYVNKRCYGQDEFDISIRDCARFLDVERKTVQRGFDDLVVAGHLERLPHRTNARGRNMPARFRFPAQAKTRTAASGDGGKSDATTTVVSKKKEREEEREIFRGASTARLKI